MTSQIPSPADPVDPAESSESAFLPLRHRPDVSTLNKDTMEADLWAFDDELDAPEESALPSVAAPPGFGGKQIVPAQRARQLVRPRLTDDHPTTKFSPAGEPIRMDVNRAQTVVKTSGPVAGTSITANELDDLEAWDDVPVLTAANALSVGDMGVPLEAVVQSQALVAEDRPDTVLTTEVVLAEDKDETVADERAAVAPVSLRPRLGLSMLERIGLLVLVVLLLGGGGVILVFSYNHLPKATQLAQANNFPIQGSYLTVVAATSYWREPILEGASRDTVRRGTQLLPVLELKARGGPAAIRVLFRNENRALVGDTVIRRIRAGETVAIPATAGFDDMGMHAAYRAGDSKPWSVEVFEAPTEDATGSAFKKLFEMNIATDRR